MMEMDKLLTHIVNNICGPKAGAGMPSIFEENPMWQYWYDYYKKELVKIVQHEDKNILDDLDKIIPEWIANPNGEVSIYTYGRKEERDQIRKDLKKYAQTKEAELFTGDISETQIETIKKFIELEKDVIKNDPEMQESYKAFANMIIAKAFNQYLILNKSNE